MSDIEKQKEHYVALCAIYQRLREVTRGLQEFGMDRHEELRLVAAVLDIGWSAISLGDSLIEQEELEKREAAK